MSLTAQQWIVMTDKDDTAPCAPFARIQQLSPEMAFIIILSWSESFIFLKNSTSKWEVLWGPFLIKLHKNDGISILTTIFKRWVAGSWKTALLSGMMDVGDGNSWGKSADARAVMKKTRPKKQLAQNIVCLSLMFTDLQPLDYDVFQRFAQLLPISWM